MKTPVKLEEAIPFGDVEIRTALAEDIPWIVKPRRKDHRPGQAPILAGIVRPFSTIARGWQSVSSGRTAGSGGRLHHRRGQGFRIRIGTLWLGFCLERRSGDSRSQRRNPAFRGVVRDFQAGRGREGTDNAESRQSSRPVFLSKSGDDGGTVYSVRERPRLSL